MSIKVDGLVKVYGQQRAVDGASFEIASGMVVGLLGANGAGKSTIMKILMGYVHADAGRAYICGIDAAAQPLAAKKQAGYLPEHNPLYHDMYVGEYLRFVYDLYGMPRHMAAAKVADVIGITGLTPEKGKKIGQLSKGYKQRVGLAQALVHEPQTLILDEPTSGLDPNQLAEIRTLIAQVGKSKTVMLSTHIMQEVEAVCSSVIIVNKGKIIANDTPHNVRRMAASAGCAPVEVLLMEHVKGEDWHVDFLCDAREMADGRWVLYGAGGGDIRSLVFNFVVQRGWTLLEMKQQEKPLEDAFRTLTLLVNNN